MAAVASQNLTLLGAASFILSHFFSTNIVDLRFSYTITNNPFIPRNFYKDKAWTDIQARVTG